ncbi:MAG TPA: GNAT family N-acetyltransferase [Burkholderiaceae bacterium]|nr:GNAT family N-acetyltransferase [Burkholderiaceae bacterium]
MKHRQGRRSCSIRQMTIGDLAEVYELGVSQFKAESWPMLYRSWDEYEVTTRFHVDGEYCLVAENNDEESARRIVGFVLGSVVSKPGSAWNYGYIVWMCVHPRWRRRNVAARLVDRLVEMMVELDGIRILMTDTDPENKRAMSFFAARGFTEQHPHVYLCSNLDTNPHYAHLRRDGSREQRARAGIRRHSAPSPVSAVVVDSGPTGTARPRPRSGSRSRRSRTAMH